MRRAVRNRAAVVAALTLVACGGATPRPTPPSSAALVPAQPPTAPAPAQPTAAPVSECTNRNLVPPTGYLQETRFGAVGEVEAVGQRALEALRGKVCGDDCATLDAAFTLWRAGTDAERSCAMAVVSKDQVEAWTRAAISAETLDASLEAAAQSLVSKGARVQISRVDDEGAPGGERVRWLLPRLSRALEAAGATPVVVPVAGRGKAGPPAGVTHVVFGSLTARTERRVPVLELALQATVHEKGTARLASAPPVVFPAAIAPYTGGRLPDAPPSDPGLSLRLDQGPDGLCLGDRTQLWLTVDAPLEVRVFDLYGAAGALLVYAGRVEPGGRRPLGGPEGFEAVPVPGSETERFLVVAAPTAAGLGELAAYSEVCRLPADRARALHAFQGLPAGARLAHDAFRITNAPPCAPADPARSRAALKLLEEVPSCR